MSGRKEEKTGILFRRTISEVLMKRGGTGRDSIIQGGNALMGSQKCTGRSRSGDILIPSVHNAFKLGNALKIMYVIKCKGTATTIL